MAFFDHGSPVKFSVTHLIEEGDPELCLYDSMCDADWQDDPQVRIPSQVFHAWYYVSYMSLPLLVRDGLHDSRLLHVRPCHGVPRGHGDQRYRSKTDLRVPVG